MPLIIILDSTQRPILQFVCILRHDGGGWAIPGGMVDPGEVVSLTLRREFMEEALNSLEMTELQRAETVAALNTLFSAGRYIEPLAHAQKLCYPMKFYTFLTTFRILTV